jgi:acetyl-CoA C-acetyltransferase
MTIDRQCSSGLMAIATAAKQVVSDGMQVDVGGEVESISLVQSGHQNSYRAADPWLVVHLPSIYVPMLQTAETVAERYRVSRGTPEPALPELLRRLARQPHFPRYRADLGRLGHDSQASRRLVPRGDDATARPGQRGRRIRQGISG